MLDQKRYSLEQAVKVIHKETGEETDPDGLLQKAKNDQIGICFFISETNQIFIQLDELDNKWKSSAPSEAGVRSKSEILLHSKA